MNDTPADQAAPTGDALEIDALGLLCPLPVLRLRKRIKGLAAGTCVDVLTDDPAALIDIPHFCHEQGHSYLGADELPGDGSSERSPHCHHIRLGA